MTRSKHSGKPKRVIVYARQRKYYVICKKHPIKADMVIIDEEFRSTHCEDCCKECWYESHSSGQCEKKEEDLHLLIYYFRKKRNMTVPNPFLKGDSN